MEPFTTFGASGYAIGDLQLFHGTAHQSAAALIADCPVIKVAKGQPVPNAQSRDGYLYIVLRGSLSVLHADAKFDAAPAIKVLPGECVGELSALNNEANADSMYALQETELLAIDTDTLWQLIDESNGIASNLLRLLSFRIHAANALLRRRQKVGEFYRQLSMVDGLTGLQNRTWLNENLPTLIGQAHRNNEPLSVLMIDLDHFKQFNDRHGHQCGDHALQAAAKAIAGVLRPTDFAARYGGEELTVILPAADGKTAEMIAQRLCEQVRQARVFNDGDRPLPHLTASFGVATLAPGQDADALIAVADAALYRAKDAGRDRVAA